MLDTVLDKDKGKTPWSEGKSFKKNIKLKEDVQVMHFCCGNILRVIVIFPLKY